MEAELVRTAAETPTILVGSHLTALEETALAERGVRLVRAGSLEGGLRDLWEDGVASILIEGGGRLAGALLSGGLVDRFYWVVSPVWLGDHGIPATRGLDVASLVQAERWTLVERRPLGQDTVLVFDRR